MSAGPRVAERSAPATLDEFALDDAAKLDAIASEAESVGYHVLVRPAVARRVARTLRSLALLSREAA